MNEEPVRFTADEMYFLWARLNDRIIAADDPWDPRPTDGAPAFRRDLWEKLLALRDFPVEARRQPAPQEGEDAR
jgi:hypothetical protein